MNGRIALTVLLMLTPLAAADSDDWNNLSQLKPGDRIQVVQTNMTSVEAEFAAFSESNITLRSGSGNSVIERDKVVRVSTKPEGRRKRNALIGALIGGGLGTAAAVMHAQLGSARDAAGSAITLTAIGALVGAVIPPGATVYRVSQIR